jgi:hypothetical protein
LTVTFLSELKGKRLEPPNQSIETTDSVGQSDDIDEIDKSKKLRNELLKDLDDQSDLDIDKSRMLYIIKHDVKSMANSICSASTINSSVARKLDLVVFHLNELDLDPISETVSKLCSRENTWCLYWPS